MTKEVLELALEALEGFIPYLPLKDKSQCNRYDKAITDIKEALAQPEPVAMKFKIYKPTVPDPLRQDINNALLPWVYDQDQSSGFDATMWVTPVATLPPQRKPLTDEQLDKAGMKLAECMDYPWEHMPEEGKRNMREYAKAIIEATHGIKE